MNNTAQIWYCHSMQRYMIFDNNLNIDYTYDKENILIYGGLYASECKHDELIKDNLKLKEAKKFILILKKLHPRK